MRLRNSRAAAPGLREQRHRVAVAAAVGQRDRLVQVLRPQHADHRAEDLLAADEHLRRHVDRRPSAPTKQPFGRPATVAPRPSSTSFAPSRTPRSMASRMRLLLLRVEDRAERGRLVQAVAELQLAGGLHEGVDDRVLLRRGRRPRPARCPPGSAGRRSRSRRRSAPARCAAGRRRAGRSGGSWPRPAPARACRARPPVGRPTPPPPTSRRTRRPARAGWRSAAR